MLTSKVHTIIRILSLSGLLALFGCVREVVTPARIPQASDSLYTDLLQDRPDRFISEIAESVGFTPANFREQFKRQYGMTPTEYKNNL